jgi:hypothetical protein
MDLVTELSVGSLYQNIAFYSFLILLASLNFDLIRCFGVKEQLRFNFQIAQHISFRQKARMR